MAPVVVVDIATARTVQVVLRPRPRLAARENRPRDNTNSAQPAGGVGQAVAAVAIEVIAKEAVVATIIPVATRLSRGRHERYLWVDSTTTPPTRL